MSAYVVISFWNVLWITSNIHRHLTGKNVPAVWVQLMDLRSSGVIFPQRISGLFPSLLWISVSLKSAGKHQKINTWPGFQFLTASRRNTQKQWRGMIRQSGDMYLPLMIIFIIDVLSIQMASEGNLLSQRDAVRTQRRSVVRVCRRWAWWDN